MKAILIRHIFSFIFPLLLALYLIPILIKTAFKFNALDKPDGKIKKHKKAIPYLGGLGIYIPFIATLAIAYPFENHILWLILGVTILLFTGFIDDFKILNPAQKFFGEFVAVICFLKGGLSLKTRFFNDFLNIAISGFWMMLVINAYNLVDVMDGLSTLLAIFAATTFLIISLLIKKYMLSLLILAFLGPLIAFFYYNKPCAKIYLGDCGSLFIGGFISALPMLFPWSSFSWQAYYAPVVIVAIPLLEVTALIIIRSWMGIPFYKGTPHHFSIYLKNKGWSVPKVLIFVSIMSLILSAVAILFLFGFIDLHWLIRLGIIYILVWCYFIFLHH